MATLVSCQEIVRELSSLLPEDVHVTERLRPLNEESVVRLMDSIRLLGLQNPISVRKAREDGPEGELDTAHVLVAGRHRLEACRRLDMYVLARVMTGSDTDLRLWEIAENLHRSDLTDLERKTHLAEWIRITEANQQEKAAGPSWPSSLSDGRKKAAQHMPSGVRQAARDLGVTRAEARRALEVDKLAPESRERAVELGLDDNQSALLAAARQPTTEAQCDVLEGWKKPRPAAPPNIPPALIPAAGADWRALARQAHELARDAGEMHEWLLLQAELIVT